MLKPVKRLDVIKLKKHIITRKCNEKPEKQDEKKEESTEASENNQLQTPWKSMDEERTRP